MKTREMGEDFSPVSQKSKDKDATMKIFLDFSHPSSPVPPYFFRRQLIYSLLRRREKCITVNAEIHNSQHMDENREILRYIGLHSLQ